MSSDNAIEVQHLGKSYTIYEKPRDRFLQMLARGKKQYFKAYPALHDVSFTIARGETVGIIGRNGSGKSTLLQMICGTLAQTSGEIITHGRIAALLELGAGFNPEFTGRENVALNASVLGLDNDTIRKRLPDILAFADIGEFIDQPVKTYSSGMVVRLAFAVIAHVDADILIIDEALAVGDAYFVQKCMRFLRQFRERGTLLFVSHDAGSVLSLCDRAIWLDAGEVRAVGSAKQVVSQYLEGLYGQSDASRAAPASAGARPLENQPPEDYRDQRHELINGSNLRNDIEVQAFNPDATAFTEGQVEILDVAFFDAGQRLSWLVGGERVQLQVHCRTSEALDQPIVGFFLKDRLGQHVFGENTYLTYMDAPVDLPPDTEFEATFDFTMPRLPAGDYALDIGVANGEQDSHRMLNWKYDALVFRVQASSVVHGMIGIPMRRILLQRR